MQIFGGGSRAQGGVVFWGRLLKLESHLVAVLFYVAHEGNAWGRLS